MLRITSGSSSRCNYLGGSTNPAIVIAFLVVAIKKGGVINYRAEDAGGRDVLLRAPLIGLDGVWEMEAAALPFAKGCLNITLWESIKQFAANCDIISKSEQLFSPAQSGGGPKQTLPRDPIDRKHFRRQLDLVSCFQVTLFPAILLQV